jgi:hypothetical protein
MAPLLSATVDGIMNLTGWNLDIADSTSPWANQNLVLSISQSDSSSRSNWLNVGLSNVDVR